MLRTLQILTLSALTSLLSAQATVIVDASGGAGSNYKTLDAAIAGAKAGDILIVRAGKYRTSTTVTKPLTIQGVGPQTEITGLSISGIPTGRSFVVKDVRVITGIFGLQCRNSAGEILLDRLHPRTAYYLVRIRTENAAAVTVRDCPAATLDTRNSFVQIHGGAMGPNSDVAIRAINSKVDIVDARVIGDAFRYGGVVTPKDAVAAFNSEIRIRGRGASVSVIQAQSWQTKPHPLVGDTTSRLVIDPVVTLVQPNSAATIAGFGGGVVRTGLPVLGSAVLPKLGAPWSYTLTSNPNDLYAVSIALPLRPTPYLGDYLRLDPRALIVMHIGRIGSTGAATFQLVHSNNPIFRGHLFLMQGVAGSGPVPTNALALSVR